MALIISIDSSSCQSSLAIQLFSDLVFSPAHRYQYLFLPLHTPSPTSLPFSPTLSLPPSVSPPYLPSSLFPSLPPSLLSSHPLLFSLLHSLPLFLPSCLPPSLQFMFQELSTSQLKPTMWLLPNHELILYKEVLYVMCGSCDTRVM